MNRNVEIIEGDVLAIDFDTLFGPKPGWHGRASNSSLSRCGWWAIFLTTSLPTSCCGCLSSAQYFESIVIMVQREVADRMAAEPGGSDYGLLSATAQLYARVEKLFTLPPGAFSPPPKVHSAVLRLTIDPQQEKLGVAGDGFIDFLRLSFGQKRKTLWNNLKGSYDDGQLKRALAAAKVKPTARAETLTLGTERRHLSCLARAAARVLAFKCWSRSVQRRRDHGNSILRHPAVAGRFYPGNRTTCARKRNPISRRPATAPLRALGCIAPHAGYMYSGHVAGAVFARIEVPRRCMVMCPNHTGMGHALAMMSEGAWETPLGDVPIDADLRAGTESSASRACRKIPPRIEPSMPQKSNFPSCSLRQPELQFVPIAVGTGRFEILEQLGKRWPKSLRAQQEPVLIVASSDMNHYESDAVTRVKDHRAIEKILALDPRGLYEVVTGRTSACAASVRPWRC